MQARLANGKHTEQRFTEILRTRTGKLQDVLKVELEIDRVRGEIEQKYLSDRGFRILQALDQVAERHQTKPAQVALAWLMTRPSITAPIASATSVEQLNELAGATRLELDRESMEKLNKASAYDEPAERIA